MSSILPTLIFLLSIAVLIFNIAWNYINNKISCENYKNAFFSLAKEDPKLRKYLKKNPNRYKYMLDVIEKISDYE